MTETTIIDSGVATDAAPAAPTFDALPLSRELRETLAEIGYVHPTPVQLAVWEPVTRGKDAVVQARTGTGKTAAFGLPIVDHLVRRSVAAVQAIALCPTRELAVQVAAEIERLGKKKGIKVVAVYGGAPMPKQVEAIANGAQVLVGTPGRVLDHLRRKTLDPKDVRIVVLDESDEMLSMGFERELSAILELMPAERQSLLFSATLPPDIERIAKSRLKSPEFITLSGDAVGALSIDHFVYLVASDKIGSLVKVIETENPESAIVFCNTRDETEAVSNALTQRGFDADWLNGDLPQNDREKVMSKTREGRLRFLVATDVAARGIDVSHLTHVINYDFPQDAEAYVHRTGRTGRAGRTGTAISLIMPQDIGGLYLLRLTYKIRPVERQIPSEGELKTRREADLVAMLAEAFTAKGVHAEDLALARRLLTHDHAEKIVAGLLRDHLGARPTAVDEAAAARRSPKPAPRAPKPEMPAPRRAPDAPVVVAAQATDAVAAPAAKQEETSPETVRRERRPDDDRRGRRNRRDDDRPRFDDRPRNNDEAPRADAPRADAPRPDAPRPPREDRPREDRPREDRPRHDRPRDDRPRGGDRGRPAPEVPVAAVRHDAASQTATAQVAGAIRPQRHADFVTWQPPEEEGDDEPILTEERPSRPERDRERPRPAHPAHSHPHAATAPQGAAPEAAPAQPPSNDPALFAEVYVNVGRRDGARAADFQRILVEGGIERDDVQRIRVRERHAFVGVKKTIADKAIALLAGATIGGKQAGAELARERTDERDETNGAPPAPADAK